MTDFGKGVIVKNIILTRNLYVVQKENSPGLWQVSKYSKVSSFLLFAETSRRPPACRRGHLRLEHWESWLLFPLIPRSLWCMRRHIIALMPYFLVGMLLHLVEHALWHIWGCCETSNENASKIYNSRCCKFSNKFILNPGICGIFQSYWNCKALINRCDETRMRSHTN